ncbi:hypothetical protein HMI55_004612 [Coelomomyces lativittatus]|nr:hypothetical protein HMI55_004612 [Coelomomyces lativittatus]KAJ1501519.1 hypothetical protein HMI56_003190 [Coelomomyces lativittatus]
MRSLPLSCECVPSVIDGHPYSRFWAFIFGECIYFPRQHIAVFFGLISLLLFGVALVPQFLMNHRRKSVHGLSWELFLIWTVADIGNTLGAYMTNQFTTQQWTGLYFLLTDFALLVQYVYYTFIYTRCSINDDLLNPSYDGIVSYFNVAPMLSVAVVCQHYVDATTVGLGTWFAWSSGILYLFARYYRVLLLTKH